MGRRRSASPMVARSAPRSIAMACVRRAISSRMTISSFWPRNPACCRSPEEKIIDKWRLQPGRMLLIDLEEGRIVSDEEIKTQLATALPYREWLERTQIKLEDLRPVQARRQPHRCLAARSPAGLRLHAGRSQAADGTHGRHRPGSRRLDGHGHPDLGLVRQGEAALHLFQAELRAGHQFRPSRPDPAKSSS